MISKFFNAKKGVNFAEQNASQECEKHASDLINKISENMIVRRTLKSCSREWDENISETCDMQLELKWLISDLIINGNAEIKRLHDEIRIIKEENEAIIKFHERMIDTLQKHIAYQNATIAKMSR